MISAGTVQVEQPRWYHKLLRFIVAGASCGFVVLIGIVALSFYMQRPKPWNRSGLHVGNVKAEPIIKLNEKMEDVATGVFFTLDVNNATNADVNLPESVTVMNQSKGSHALHGSFLKLDKTYFIPARHTVTVSLTAADLCSAKTAPQECFNTYFQDDEEVVLFDDSQKYELHIPIPTLTVPKDAHLWFSQEK